MPKKEKANYSKPYEENFIRTLIIGMLICIFLLLVFGSFAEDLLHDELLNFDMNIGNFVRSFQSPVLTNITIIITYIGSSVVDILVLITAVTFMYLHMNHKRESIILACNLGGSWILNEVLKEIFKRARPDVEHLVWAGGYSFPSGHAMISMSFYGMLGYIIYSYLKNSRKVSWYIIILTFLLVSSIGLSRIYLGVHYPSDVLAGFAAGGAWLVACVMALHTINYYRY